MNANDFLTRVHLSFFTFFSWHTQALCIAIPRVHPFLIFPLLASCFSVLGPSDVNGLSHPWVIACFSSPSLYLYISDGFTFPDPHTGLFPLNLVEGQPKPQTVPPWPIAMWRLGTSKFLSSFLFHFLSCMRMLCAFMYMSHTMCLIVHAFMNNQLERLELPIHHSYTFCRRFGSIIA